MSTDLISNSDVYPSTTLTRSGLLSSPARDLVQSLTSRPAIACEKSTVGDASSCAYLNRFLHALSDLEAASLSVDCIDPKPGVTSKLQRILLVPSKV
ncbi:uncharacterized protein L969DRAFT_96510 [Mixia osmundae IAM 14324]|uniref:Uncharacterized protein n=1 Tax=Mixia osmundae (strain CBS 9802 / IAM 14324 / JCM 22182 / KY 12970) TaxID=764103 RepID=G7DUU0_MIXOS|nr:uncharacterized protein L969DRAFT_96510 [Mixia osmundae IAM 14324]KEI37432.1 hypothetical protein L969DRAFT_96510 [Mixia osmundae IAM 14324]GAA94350.1 hypothetical protein E5Q_01001 [Mixia osmundae IAM 14324]